MTAMKFFFRNLLFLLHDVIIVETSKLAFYYFIHWGCLRRSLLNFGQWMHLRHQLLLSLKDTKFSRKLKRSTSSHNWFTVLFHRTILHFWLFLFIPTNRISKHSFIMVDLREEIIGFWQSKAGFWMFDSWNMFFGYSKWRYSGHMTVLLTLLLCTHNAKKSRFCVIEEIKAHLYSLTIRFHFFS